MFGAIVLLLDIIPVKTKIGRVLARVNRQTNNPKNA